MISRTSKRWLNVIKDANNRCHMLALLGFSLILPIGAHAANKSQLNAIPFIQPTVCNGTSADTATFQSVGGRMPLFLNCQSLSGEPSGVVNLPANVPVNTISVEVIPTSSTDNLFVSVFANYFPPGNPVAGFFELPMPLSITGRSNRNKNLQFNFNVPVQTQNYVPLGSIYESGLSMSIFAARKTGSGTVYIDNVLINGQPVTFKKTTPIPCPF